MKYSWSIQAANTRSFTVHLFCCFQDILPIYPNTCANIPFQSLLLRIPHSTTMPTVRIHLCPNMVWLVMLTLTCISLSLPAQENISWIRRYELDTLEILFPSGYEQCGEDAVLMMNATGFPEEPLVNKTMLVRIDGQNGDLIWQTRLDHNPVADSSQLFFFSRGMARLRDGSYLILMQTVTENNDGGFALYRITSDGEVLWHKDYGTSGQEILVNNEALGLGPDSMSVAVTARRLDIPDPSSLLYIYHIDADGVVLNELQLTTHLAYYSENTPITMLNDSSFVIGLNLANFDFEGVKMLWHVDYKGEILKAESAWDLGFWAEIKRHPTGNVVVTSQTNTGEASNRDKHGLRTTMYTSTLDTIWSRIYNHYELPFYYREYDFPGPFSFDAEGNILVSGDGSAYNGVRPAHLVMYDVDGNTLWKKRIGIEPTVGEFVQSIGGKIVFDQHGILLVGSNIVNGIQLIRLDSNACVINEPCETEILLPVEEEMIPSVVSFKLSPNPAIDHVNISMPVDLFKSLDNPVFHVIDLTGRALHSSILTNSDQEIQLDNLHPGMYMIILKAGEHEIGIQKLIIGLN